MKKKFTEFFKGKGYYVLLFVGVIAIAAVALIGSRLSTQPGDSGNKIDLNDNNIAAGQDDTDLAKNNPSSNVVVNNGQGGNQQSSDITKDNTAKNNSNDSLLEYDVYSQQEEAGIDLAVVEAQTGASAVTQAPEAVETSGKTVTAKNATKNALSFNKDNGLLWPVKGNVLMNYSIDRTIYHATLMQFKTNPAIIIDAEIGTEVKAAAEGIISSIVDNEETGTTITMDIGSGYSLVYGQLEDVTLKAGDKVTEGAIIGKVAKPTKYFVVEGSNLYFKVLENDKTINPMSLLR